MRIAVIGAGVSGLTFAAAMRQKAPAAEVTLGERDESASSRPQGYAIGLRNGIGLAALADFGTSRRRRWQELHQGHQHGHYQPGCS